jgi:hypothetical protein
MATAHLLFGYMGAGKAALAAKLEREIPAPRFSPDEWLTTLFDNDEANVKPDVRTELDRIEALIEPIWCQCLQAGADVVLDMGFGLEPAAMRYAEKPLNVMQKPSCITSCAMTMLPGIACRPEIRIPAEASKWSATPSTCSRPDSKPSAQMNGTTSSTHQPPDDNNDDPACLGNCAKPLRREQLIGGVMGAPPGRRMGAVAVDLERQEHVPTFHET